MAYETIRTARDGDVLTITLNRPERLNAAPPQMFEEIGAALDDLGGARALLFIGEGRAFCSGADLAGRVDPGVDPAQATWEALSHSYNPTMAKLSKLDVPVVSAVRGPAAGIGCSLALAADFCIVSNTAYFLQAFVNIGLVPDGGASWMLPRLIGKARATEMMMLGERIPADKALDWGLVHKVVDDTALEAEAQALATRLAAGPTRALGAMRRNLMRALESDYTTALGQEADEQREMRRTEDSREGAIAFLQKRKAAFAGK